MKHILSGIALIAIASISAQPAYADAEAKQGYFSVMGTYVDDDNDRGIDDGPGGQFGFGYAINEQWNIEALYQGAKLGEHQQSAFGVDIQRVFMRAERFSPYVFVGAGPFESKEPSPGLTRNGSAYAYGAGFLADLFSSNVALRGEWRRRTDSLGSDDLTDNLFSIGLQIPFGPATPKWSDADGDGVQDGRDRCPNTPAGTEVDANGCPLDSDGDGVNDTRDRCPGTPKGVAVDDYGCPPDSDGDGVTNDKDQCPGTVAGAKVDAKGCELDSDGDGVVDRIDECPGTPAGAQVDLKGCEIKEEIALRGVEFETNSDRLVRGTESILDDAAAVLKKYPTIRIEVAGHTDSDGTAEYNEGLSTRRARTVNDYLIANGIAGNRMTVRGYGESQPIADNVTRAGKAENRRVVLRILER